MSRFRVVDLWDPAHPDVVRFNDLTALASKPKEAAEPPETAPQPVSPREPTPSPEDEAVTVLARLRQLRDLMRR